MPGWEERQALVLWAGRHGEMEGGTQCLAVAEWMSVNPHFCLAELPLESCQKFWCLLRCGKYLPCSLLDLVFVATPEVGAVFIKFLVKKLRHRETHNQG